MKVLVLGSGGREHALAESFFRFGHAVFCHPGNPGMREFSEPLCDPSHSVADFSKLAAAIREKKIDLTLVGPEKLLCLGIADFFRKENLLLFGPTKKAAQIETSKAWSKQFMQRYEIPTADFHLAQGAQNAKDAARIFFSSGKKAVIKPSGLTAGKGAVCCDTFEEAEEAIENSAEYGAEIIVEEHLEGPEVSILALCDGKKIAPLIPAQDHKRLNNGGLGPNTGGLGAIAPASVSEKALSEIESSVISRTMRGLIHEGIDYRGTLYFGLILTKKGPKVLEYNCRLGDPETQAVLPLIESDLAQLLFECAEGDLKTEKIRFKRFSSCCVVLASKGYPSAPKTGFEIQGIQSLAKMQNLHLFHAGTARDPLGNLVTSGGRVLGVTGLGASLQEAIETAYKGARQLSFEGAHYRTDIGKHFD